jgi:hypothetical protein
VIRGVLLFLHRCRKLTTPSDSLRATRDAAGSRAHCLVIVTPIEPSLATTGVFFARSAAICGKKRSSCA